MTDLSVDDLSAFKESVAQDAAQDPFGAYEVWWEANSRYPLLRASERLAIAERVVDELLAEGRVHLCRKPWISGDYERVSDDEIAATLTDWATWVPQDEPTPMIWLSGDIPER
jgi:hypothetical protein